MEQNKSTHLWSIDFVQWCQGSLMGERIVFGHMMLGWWNIHGQNKKKLI